MLLVVFGGFAWYRLAGAEDVPARAFTELEFAASDSDHTGTCYALSTVLIANGVNGNSVRTWNQPDKNNDGEWMLTLESVSHGPGGPAHVFQKFTFARHGEQIWLVAVDASRGLPTDIDPNIDRLLERPHELQSTPVDRCRATGVRGYQFPPQR